MTEHTASDLPAGSGLDAVLDALGRAVSLVGFVLKWVVTAVLALVWLGFWSNLARIHYAHGDLAAAGLSVLAIVVPVTLVALWRRSG